MGHQRSQVRWGHRSSNAVLPAPDRMAAAAVMEGIVWIKQKTQKQENATVNREPFIFLLQVIIPQGGVPPVRSVLTPFPGASPPASSSLPLRPIVVGSLRVTSSPPEAPPPTPRDVPGGLPLHLGQSAPHTANSPLSYHSAATPERRRSRTTPRRPRVAARRARAVLTERALADG